MYKNIVRNNITLFSIILFVFIFTFIQILKPAFLYNKNGSVREFGIGYKNKTIFPIWVLSLILGILCYLFVIYYVSRPVLF
jgi:sterol desaturase/sphingolipid hydroxylase (fatty acid hydroxylase superfamily)